MKSRAVRVRIAIRSSEEWTVAYLTATEDLADAKELGRVRTDLLDASGGAEGELYRRFVDLWTLVANATSRAMGGPGESYLERPPGGQA